MTTEDKNWIYIGIGLATTGGLIYWYKNKDSQTKAGFKEPLNLENIEVPNKPELATPKLNSNINYKPKPIVSKKPQRYNPTKPINIAMPTYMYAIGQKIMCNNRGGSIANDVQKAADGTFFTNLKKVKTFTFGEEIGEIVAVKLSKGFVFYICKGKPTAYSDSDDNRMYWVNHMTTKHIGVLMPTKSLKNVPSLDVTKILSKGSKGLEVSQLQKLLKIEIDGDFGNKTETALFAIKKVKEISINQF